MLQDFPFDLKDKILPEPSGRLVYECCGCNKKYPVDELLYTCPECGGIFMLPDKDEDRLLKISGITWRRIFDYRKMMAIDALRGVYLFHELIGSIIPLDAIVYLGEGHTPCIKANDPLRDMAGMEFYFKNDGQNPSASFKDRGMASALSYLNFLRLYHGMDNILSVCASTGDTSAAAALYASYLSPYIKSAVLLPRGKVTPQQLSQPLGSGAMVFEIPGVFDDCMKVVEALADNYDVALLNSKNPWRIRGQESYSYEIAQWFQYDLTDKVIVIPIGNAGNISAIMSGFLRLHRLGIITTLPMIIGVQSEHANPVYLYYLEPDRRQRTYRPVTVKPSVAQAAMIGDPVSMPRVIKLVEEYNDIAGEKLVYVVEVTEQEIIDHMLIANRNGHIACTQGGESLAGMIRAKKNNIIKSYHVGILDSTAHALKFSGFQEKYFTNSFEPEYNIKSQKNLINKPVTIIPKGLKDIPMPGKILSSDSLSVFIKLTSQEIAKNMGLKIKG